MGLEVPVCGYLEVGGALQCMTQRMERNKGLNRTSQDRGKRGHQTFLRSSWVRREAWDGWLLKEGAKLGPRGCAKSRPEEGT